MKHKTCSYINYPNCLKNNKAGENYIHAMSNVTRDVTDKEKKGIRRNGMLGYTDGEVIECNPYEYSMSCVH
jgi:hypothetical protein